MQPDSKLLRRASAHLRRADPVLAGLMARVGPCRYQVDTKTPPFAALVESIMYQQITGKAAASIHRRLCGLVGGRLPRPEELLRLSDADLRGAGLSRQKIGYLRDLSTHVMDGLALGRLWRLGDEEVIQAVTAVKGIGRWTGEMYLMFRLGRLDVLPVDDYGIRKAMQRAYRMRKLPKPDRMVRVAESWRPYRSLACWYLWRSLEQKTSCEPP